MVVAPALVVALGLLTVSVGPPVKAPAPRGLEELVETATDQATGEDEEEEGSWESAVDSKTGNTYYYHTVTRETRWTLPAELQPNEPEPDPCDGLDFFSLGYARCMFLWHGTGLYEVFLTFLLPVWSHLGCWWFFTLMCHFCAGTPLKQNWFEYILLGFVLLMLTWAAHKISSYLMSDYTANSQRICCLCFIAQRIGIIFTTGYDPFSFPKCANYSYIPSALVALLLLPFFNFGPKVVFLGQFTVGAIYESYEYYLLVKEDFSVITCVQLWMCPSEDELERSRQAYRDNGGTKGDVIEEFYKQVLRWRGLEHKVIEYDKFKKDKIKQKRRAEERRIRRLQLKSGGGQRQMYQM